MALQHLTDEQIATMTRAQKDEWWFKNVFRGDMAQLTLRSGLTGFLLGGILSATGLYIGAKTGIAVGVGLTSVILAFALFRALHASGIASDYTILENNCTQSIATASGYVVTPLFSSLVAYMMVTGVIPPWWQLMQPWVLKIVYPSRSSSVSAAPSPSRNRSKGASRVTSDRSKATMASRTFASVTPSAQIAPNAAG